MFNPDIELGEPRIVRTTSTLTSSYVGGTVFSLGTHNAIIVELGYTKGDETSMQLKVETSVDGTNFYQEVFESISAGVDTLTPGERSIAVTGSHRFLVPVRGKKVRISVKATGGTPTGTAAIEATPVWMPNPTGSGAGGGGGSGSSGDIQASGADAESNTANSQRVASRMYGFNGTTWDRIRTAISGAVSTITGILNVINLSKYVSSVPTLSDGQFHPPRLTVNGAQVVSLDTLSAGENLTNNVQEVVDKPLPVPTYTYLLSKTFGTDVSISAKGTAGNVFSFDASNKNAALRYFQIFNKASAPANGDTPIFSFPIPAGTAAQPGACERDNKFFGTGGYHFATGVAWGVSSTEATFTEATAADHDVHLNYI